MPTPRYEASAVSLEGKIYLIGGRAGEDSLAPVERYDPKLDTWDTTVANLRQPRAHAAAVVYNGMIYVFGGEDRKSHALKSVERYDPRMNRWQPMQDLLAPRSAPAAVVYQGAILILGGSDSEGNYRNDVEIYDVSRNQMAPGAQFLLTINRTSSQAAVYNNDLYLFGGLYYGPLATIERFSLASGWETVGTLSHPRGDFALVQIDNRFYIIGGQGYSGIEPTVEVWAVNQNGDLKEEQEIFWPNPLAGVAAAHYGSEILLFGGEDPLREEIVATVQSLELFPVTSASRAHAVPEQPELVRAFPNPTTGKTTFLIRVPDSARSGQFAILRLFNLRGELIWQGRKKLLGGQSLFVWNGTDQHGHTAPRGIYFYRVQAGNRNLHGKLLIIR